MPLVCVGLSHHRCLTSIFGVPWHFRHYLSVLCAISPFSGVAASLFSGQIRSFLVLCCYLQASCFQIPFAVKFIDKIYSAWEFQFRLFSMGKEL